NMGTSAEDVSPSRPQLSCPSVCPLCGSGVRIAQCGWMRAMPVCDNAQCLYPMVSELPAPNLARPYTDMPASPPAASSSSPTAKLDHSDADSQAVSIESVSHLPVEPDEVFVHTMTEPDRSGPFTAAALTTVLCGPVQRRASAAASTSSGTLAACSRAYAKALRLTRASLHPAQVSSGRVSTRRQFRNLELVGLADIERSVLRELDSLDRLVAKPLSLSVSDVRDDFYETAHRLLKSDKRLAKQFQSVHTLRQVCTVCFKQHVSRQKATVLRLSDPATDFDLFDPNKRVFLRPCQHCRAPQQRVLLRWEKSSDGRQPISDAVFLEARDGLPGPIQLNKSLRTHDGLALIPTAAVQRLTRSSQSNNQFYYVIWLYSRDSKFCFNN
ncbi:hypothetical protein BOX15_Mlig016927g2, partial [Macrostomum lignano]